ncbi:MAG: hypothetical protein CVV64_15800 [Candidatus Wallbacteria bacterium HGW-Wallbacteria-1]|jgi:hypothetical protein|uniref:Uncharacterized protein n=1 Tax=Candidatus Wallbacteria bacterium HGW-Wallbacteria-1 TaxID=2013854 RepID=A0A2N1PL88_9BACT|nr:MAG: hypothetical protein CVV64_15800 [Candidatus Wallbacteria bacterium HGW-Wallbacteria-1]
MKASLRNSLSCALYAFLVFTFILPVIIPPQAIHAKLYARKDRGLSDFKVPPLQVEAVRNLITEIGEIRETIRAELEARGKKGKKIDHHEHIVACDYLASELEVVARDLSIRKKGSNIEEISGRYIRALRVLYSLKAEIKDVERANLLEKAKSPLVMGLRVLGSPLVIRIPKDDPDDAIGNAKAHLESSGLYDADGRQVDPDQIGSMTHRQVSKLELGPKSRVFNSFSRLQGATRWAALEKFIQGLVRQYDRKYSDFDLTKARRCWFFSKVKGSATSPKILVEDSWGLPWKLKWGDEVHTETFMARFYVAMGAKYSDLKYYMAPSSAPVILDKISEPGDGKGNLKDSKGDDEAVSYLYQLQEVLLNSRFSFHLQRYVPQQGLILDSAGRPLGHGIVDENFCEKYEIRKKYIGRWYVFFKEASMTFYSPTLKRVGPAPFSELGAETNRAARGSVVFNCFFNNKDCKDDNNNLGLIFNPKTGIYDCVVEYQHDLGCTMGGLQTSGDINTFDWDFIARFPGFLGFKMRTLYYPNAWKVATFADAIWMARKIADVPVNVYKWALSETGWPQFYQRLVLEKLMSRRNEMIKVFGLDKEGYVREKVDDDLTVKVRLSNGKTDKPVKNGKIASPKDSVLVAIEEESHHPEGLHKVVPRSRD